MAEIDVVLTGVVNNGYKEITSKLATFKMFVTVAVMNNHDGAERTYSVPMLISIHLRDYSGLSREEKYSLGVVGTEVKVHVFGALNDYQVKIIKVRGRTRCTLNDFVMALEKDASEKK